MAKIGLDNFFYSPIESFGDDGTPEYTGAKKPGKAVSCKVDITNNSAELYADNTLAESDTSFQAGTAAITIDEEDAETSASLLGHEFSDGTVIRSSYDVAPYVGFGRVITKMVNGVYKYKVEILYKVKFSEPSQDNSTKGKSTEFGTTELSGTVSALDSGKWSLAKEFDDKEEARNYIKEFFEPTASVSKINTYSVNSSSETVTDEQDESAEATLEKTTAEE